MLFKTYFYYLEKFVGRITRGTVLGTWPLIEQWSKLYYIGGEGDAEIFSHKIHHNCYNGACTFWPPSWRDNDGPTVLVPLQAAPLL